MTTFVIPLLLASWFGGQLPSATAAPESTAPLPTAAEIDAAVERLGSNRFAEREAATEFLWQAGPASLSALEAAAKSKDLERAKRAHGLLEKVRWGIRPDTSPEILKLIGQYRIGNMAAKQAVLRKLRDLQRYDAIVDLLRADGRSAQNDQLSREFAREIRGAAMAALASGDPQQAEALLLWTMRLDTSGQGVRDYAAYLALTGKEEAEIARLQRELKLQAAAEPARLLAQLLLYQGKYAAARVAAVLANDESLQTEAAYGLQDWATLASRYVLTDKTSIEQFAFALKFQRLAGNRVEAERALVGIRDLAKRDPTQLWMCVEALLLNEEWLEADRISMTAPKTRIELLCDQLRYREALELLGPRGEPGWADEWYVAGAAKWEPETSEANVHFSLALDAARALYLVGERDEAGQLFDALAVEAPHVKHYSRWRSLLEMELRVGRREAAERRALDLLADDEAVAQIMYAFYGTQSAAAKAWWGFLRLHFPTDDRAATWQRLAKLLKPGDGSPFDDATLPELMATAFKAAAGTTPQVRSGELQAIAEVCLLRRDPQRAVGFFEHQIQAIDSIQNAGYSDSYAHPAATALMKIGDVWSERKEWLKAASAYESACTRGPTQALPLYLRGHALLQAGQEKLGRELMQRAELLPLAGGAQRRLLAAGLQERGLTEAARAQRLQLLRMAVRTAWDFDTLNTAETEAKQLGAKGIVKADPLWSYLQLCLLRAGTSMSVSLGYRELAQAIHTGRAWGHWEAGRQTEAIAELKLAQAARPSYTPFAETAVQRLDAAGRRAEADALFDTAFTVYTDCCRDFPLSAWHHNGAAWLATQCDRRLDEALKLAQTAVRLRPENAAYWDTLAEVHFRRGEFAKAVELEEQAVKLAPDDEEIAAQMKKFRAAVKP